VKYAALQIVHSSLDISPAAFVDDTIADPIPATTKVLNIRRESPGRSGKTIRGNINKAKPKAIGGASGIGDEVILAVTDTASPFTEDAGDLEGLATLANDTRSFSSVKKRASTRSTGACFSIHDR
jgi:hypothetical protein